MTNTTFIPELQKVGCSKLFCWDEEMKCPETGAYAICNTSELNDDLGQIEYLFTDKTGTLTENKLSFLYCSVSGSRYKYLKEKSVLVKSKNESGETSEEIEILKSDELKTFFETLALCHSVKVLSSETCGEDLKLSYQAESIDEETLIKSAHS